MVGCTTVFYAIFGLRQKVLGYNRGSFHSVASAKIAAANQISLHLLRILSQKEAYNH